MFRRFLMEDLQQVMDLWLRGNKTAHDFIPAKRWEEAYDTVAEALPEAEVYLCEEERVIKGFIGVYDSKYIAGLFVDQDYQKKGIGKGLLAHCQRNYPALWLDVFMKNTYAVAFYEKNGFSIEKASLNETFGEMEYRMVWQEESLG